MSTPLGPNPTPMSCPHCRSNITTIVTPTTTTKTHIVALVLCLFGCWCCAPCVYCTDSFRAKMHYCPNCNRYIGQYD